MAIADVSQATFGAQQTQSAGDAPAKAASVALVPVGAAPRRLTPASQGLTRPNPCFVTHLIAMAELSPQTRLLRRAAPEHVQAAYRSVANQNRTVTPPGVRMRQIA
jgi:streptogramin lyase